MCEEKKGKITKGECTIELRLPLYKVANSKTLVPIEFQELNENCFVASLEGRRKQIYYA